MHWESVQGESKALKLSLYRYSIPSVGHQISWFFHENWNNWVEFYEYLEKNFENLWKNRQARKIDDLRESQQHCCLYKTKASPQFGEISQKINKWYIYKKNKNAPLWQLRGEKSKFGDTSFSKVVIKRNNWKPRHKVPHECIENSALKPKQFHHQ